MNTVVEQYNDFIHSGDPTLRQYFFLRSIKPMVFLVSFYVLFVTFIGPAIMRKRKAIELRKVIICYNFCLVVYYSYFLLYGAYFLYLLGLSTFCDNTLDSKKNPLVAKFYFHGYVMYVVRYVELIDTVFLVLSKKFRMVTPLHVFHHSIVPVFGWFGFRSERSTYLSAFMALNSFIHIIMYSYYAVAALGPQYQKYLWWKKYLTFLQITQFFFTTLYIVIMYAVGCVASKFLGICCGFLMVLFFFWFIDFYRRTFQIKQQQQLSKKVHLNGEDKKSLLAQFFAMSIYLTTMYAIGCSTSRITVAFICFLSVLFFFWFIVYYKNTIPQEENRPSKVNSNTCAAPHVSDKVSFDDKNK